MTRWLPTALALVLLHTPALGFAPTFQTKQLTALRVSKEALEPVEGSRHEWYTDGSGWPETTGSVNQDDDWVEKAFNTHTDTGLDESVQKKPKKHHHDLEHHELFTEAMEMFFEQDEQMRADSFSQAMLDFTPPAIQSSTSDLTIKDLHHHEWFTTALDDVADQEIQKQPPVPRSEKQMGHTEWFSESQSTFSPPLHVAKPDAAISQRADWFGEAQETFTPPDEAVAKKAIASPIDIQQGPHDLFTEAIEDFRPKHDIEWFTEALETFRPPAVNLIKSSGDDKEEVAQPSHEWFSQALKDFENKPVTRNKFRVAASTEVNPRADWFSEALWCFLPPETLHSMTPHDDDGPNEWFTEALEGVGSPFE